MSNIIIDRVIFNFTNTCYQNCEFCYIPFDKKGNGNVTIWYKIFRRCIELGAKLITFGGGDPFAVSEFQDFLLKVDEFNIDIHIDTNGVFLNDGIIPIMKKVVKLVGLPLDGPRDVHSDIRKNSTHFDMVCDWIGKLIDERIPVKVHTVVTKRNINELEKLSSIIRALKVNSWHLYQFWPIGPCKHHKIKFEITKKYFLESTIQITKDFPSCNIEISTFDERALSYFFTTSLGKVYTVDKSNNNKYVVIGNIFEKDIISKWCVHGNKLALEERAKKRTYEQSICLLNKDHSGLALYS